MRIALIFPPYEHKIFSENLSIVDEEFCFAPPIILAYVAAILEQNGHEVILLDLRALGLDKKQTLKKLKEFNPDILGFRAESYHFHDALDWIGYLKSNLKIPVIAGGPNPSLYPKETLTHEEIDYGIVGEAIDCLPNLLSAFENRKDFSAIPGVAYKNKDRTVCINAPASNIADFDAYPLPARHLLPNEVYYSFISQRKNFTIMLTSTGCPFECVFCAIPAAYRVRSVEKVLREIEICYHEFGVREIDFFDAVFFLNKGRTLDFLSGLKRLGLDLEWSCRSRVDIVDEEILKAAAGAGCRQIYYGIESAEQDVLNKIKKQIVVEQAEKSVRLSKKYGIRTMGFFMIGNDGDTRDSILKTIDFAKSIGLDFVQVCRTIAKPGTVLHVRLNNVLGVDLWKEHILGKKLDRRLPTPWSELTQEEVFYLTRKFYFEFYFRLKIILLFIFRLRSFNELCRYIKAGLGFLCRTNWRKEDTFAPAIRRYVGGTEFSDNNDTECRNPSENHTGKKPRDKSREGFAENRQKMHG